MLDQVFVFGKSTDYSTWLKNIDIFKNKQVKFQIMNTWYIGGGGGSIVCLYLKGTWEQQKRGGAFCRMDFVD